MYAQPGASKYSRYANKELEIELFMRYANIDILCITEHWLGNYQLRFGFVNHQVASSFSREREREINTWRILNINKKLKFKERTDIVCLSVERVIEIACVELERLVVVSVYRPPHSSYELFESVMDQTLCKISDKSKKIAICGDFNVGLLDASNRGGEIWEFFGCCSAEVGRSRDL
ncbi:hypothetical protein EVAR_39110_1 [Eumeta japonica]|uniref:Endonuclease/exonuclease/phosphatase domain-containing protein n=1 Tax=Eumeta variegata TaxID=151549 RepID=A0A4C1X3X9_EUMVA|nr:hypothetical protein EVAR_39110_1 [Eumeta japonica]